jgi:hypothetical protein
VVEALERRFESGLSSAIFKLRVVRTTFTWQAMYAYFRVYILDPILIPYTTSRTLKPSFSVLYDDARSASRNFQTWIHVAHWRLSVAMHSAGAFEGRLPPSKIGGNALPKLPAVHDGL